MARSSKPKQIVSTVGATMLGAASSQAVVSMGDINVVLDTTDDGVWLDVLTGAFFTSDPNDNTQFDLDILFRDGNAVISDFHAKADLGVATNDTQIIVGPDAAGTSVKRFGHGEVISGEESAGSETENPSGVGNWGGFTGIAYVGFTHRSPTTSQQEFGWLELDYQAGNPGGSITVRSFAYGDEGETARAGLIPEPARAGSVAALLAGGAAFFSRRRRN
ncbi:MAG: hypothetical protein AAGJ81_04870 [Verrucomicrobiota bacterium]